MPKRKVTAAKIPIHGKAAHNTAFLVSIGNLVVNWGNNESVFMAMLQLLVVGGKHSAAIVWHSHRTTHARLELVERLCRERLADEKLVKDILKAIENFKGLSRVRNFYCHATYSYDSELCFATASGASYMQEGYPIKFETKRMDRAMINEMADAALKLGELNGRLWKLVMRLETALGIRLVNLPEQARIVHGLTKDQASGSTDAEQLEK